MGISTICCATFLLLTASAYAQLQLFQAGPYAQPLSTLGDEARICPSDFEDPGFTISCTVPSEINPDSVYSVFYVGNILTRMEKRNPFYIAGNDRSQKITNGWDDYPKGTVTPITCVLKNMESSTIVEEFSSNITFACNDEEVIPPDEGEDSDNNNNNGRNPIDFPDGTGPTYTPPPANSEPGALYYVPASGDMMEKMAIRVETRTPFCPDSMFNTKDFSIECITSVGATIATFTINDTNGDSIRATSTGRFYINDGVDDSPTPWNYPEGPFSISCQTDAGDITEAPIRGVEIYCPPDAPEPPTVTTTPNPTATAIATTTPYPSFSSSPEPIESDPKEPKREACVALKLCNIDPINRLSRDWKMLPYGILFRKRGRYPRKTYPPGTAEAIYRFRAPVAGRYGIVVEMKSVYRNKSPEIYVKFDGPMELRREGSSTTRTMRNWVIGYHKGKRLSAETVVSDLQYSISTKDDLEKGARYKIAVSGRKNGVLITKIFLFPCGSGTNCQRESKVWKRAVSRCVRYDR